MLFGRQNSDDNAQNTDDAKHSEYVSSLDNSSASPQASNPALPPDDSIFAPQSDSSTSADQSAPQEDVVTPQPSVETPQETPSEPPALTSEDAPTGSDGLLGLKQEALDHLTPLVDHLEQSPEEKFRTTMMMIQSTDNQALLKDAFSAAKEIQDDKARAQALLDVINEINYFTQKG